MKRDVDLARQLLFDIEARGSECSFGSLHPATNGEAVRNGVNGRATEELHDDLHGYPSESVRYHLRLLIDAGFVKEVDRTTAGVLCVRLTHSGHELLDLCRHDLRWRDAKACCLDNTGGLSLTVLRAILTKWAVESAASGVRHFGYYGRRRAAHRPLYYHRVEPRRRYESSRYESARYAPPRYYDDARAYDYGYDYPLHDEEIVRTRPADYRSHDYRDAYRESWVRPVDRAAYDRYERDYVVRDEVDTAEPTVGVSLPVSLI